MQILSVPLLTICGIEELADHCDRQVTHVLSIVDPTWPEIGVFQSFAEHHRTTMRFHDVIEEQQGMIAPQVADVEAIIRFGAELDACRGEEGHLLVHCHMGVSRSTAAMLTLLAEASPDDDEDRLHERLRQIRPQAWPNSRMVAFADELLGRNGRLTTALCRHYGHQLRAKPEIRDWMTRNGRETEVAMALTPCSRSL